MVVQEEETDKKNISQDCWNSVLQHAEQISKIQTILVISPL